MRVSLLRVAAALGLASLTPSALAITVRSLQSTYSAPTYRVSLVALVDAPPQDVEAVLVDYRNYRQSRSQDPHERGAVAGVRGRGGRAHAHPVLRGVLLPYD